MSRQKAPVEPAPIDWEAEKNEWLQYLDILYKDVEIFLYEYVKENRISITYENMNLNEENIGQYTVREMRLAFGNNRLRLTPIGTLLIGTKGRVDMVGPRGTVRLILADKESAGIKVIISAQALGRGAAPTEQPFSQEPRKIDWEWKIVVSTTPQLTYRQLTQEAFFDAIIEVSYA